MTKTAIPGDDALSEVTAAVLTDNLFTASRLSDPRYVWDPMVHKTYGETCYVALLRLSDQVGDPVGRIKAAADDLGIESVAVYKLFGYFDTLVRFWSTERRMELLSRQLKAYGLDDGGPTVQVVKIDRAYYDDWAEHDPTVDRATVGRFEDEIKTLTSVDRYPSAAEIEHAVQRLVDVRLLHLMDPSYLAIDASDDLLKVYVLLTRTAAAPDYEEAALRRSIKKMEALHLKSTYYSNSALMCCFIKGVIVASNFGSLDRAVRDLQETLESEHHLRMRTTTLIVANLDAPESDKITSDLPEASGTRWDKLAGYLSRDAQRSLERGPKAYLAKMFELFDESQLQASGEPFVDEFRAVLDALASRDRVRLERSLSFVLVFEGMIRAYFTKKLLPEVFGPEWHNVLQAAIQGDTGVATGSSARKTLTLGNILVGVGRLIDQGRLDANTIAEELDHGWQERLQGLVVVRNAAAHGDIPVDWDPDSTSWPSGESTPKPSFEYARRVFAIATIYNRLSTTG